MSKQVKFGLTKLLSRLFDKPLPAPTPGELKLVDEIRRVFDQLPALNPAEAPPSETAWLNNLNRLRELMLRDDPRRFLRWDVVQDTMFITQAKYIRKELKFLKNRPDWRNRWRQAIIEAPIGHPVPYPLYPRSSGNLIHHAYHLAIFEVKTGLRVNDMEFVFEFGGGYGSMARLFSNLGFQGRYVIFDLPHFSRLQQFYLKAIGSAVHSPNAVKIRKPGVRCISELEQLELLLINGLDPGRSMFMATWSLSETPVGLRDSILPLVSRFDAFLVAYQDYFGEVDNLDFFRRWRTSLEGQVVWQEWPIEHIPGNNYLVGVRRPEDVV